MSSISGISSASTAWSDVSSTRSAATKQRMFDKVDADGSGGVDSSELQTALDKMADMTGTTAPTTTSARDTFTKMDTDGNGSLDSSELDAGMKSLMPAPSSTVDFAQQRGDGSEKVHGGGGHHRMEGPPPDADSTDSTDSTTSASSSTSATALNPLDTNGDGTVSAEEQAAGDVKQMIGDLFQAADSDGNGKLSSSEVDTLKQNFDTALTAMENSASSSSTSSSSSSSDSSSTGSDSSSQSNQNGFDMSALTTLTNLVLKEYAANASTSATTQAASISVAA